MCVCVLCTNPNLVTSFCLNFRLKYRQSLLYILYISLYTKKPNGLFGKNFYYYSKFPCLPILCVLPSSLLVCPNGLLLLHINDRLLDMAPPPHYVRLTGSLSHPTERRKRKNIYLTVKIAKKKNVVTKSMGEKRRKKRDLLCIIFGVSLTADGGRYIWIIVFTFPHPVARPIGHLFWKSIIIMIWNVILFIFFKTWARFQICGINIEKKEE